MLGVSVRKILIVEDDADLREELAEALTDNAFDVRSCADIRSFWQQFRQFAPEAVVLDMGLPDGRGQDLLREIRGQSDVAVLIVSGRRDETDRIVALELGADDFLVKPCSPRELVARINAVIRRIDPAPGPPTPGTARRVISFADYRLDLAAMELSTPGGEICPLTTAEFELLRLFVERPQRVLSRDQLLDLLRGEGWAGYDRTVDGLVSRLRKKIALPDCHSQIIRTIRGSGYIFTQPVL